MSRQRKVAAASVEDHVDVAMHKDSHACAEALGGHEGLGDVGQLRSDFLPRQRATPGKH